MHRRDSTVMFGWPIELADQCLLPRNIALARLLLEFLGIESLRHDSSSSTKTLPNTFGSVCKPYPDHLLVPRLLVARAIG